MDKKVLDKIWKAIKCASWDDENPLIEYRTNLRKYVFSKCMLQLCDKKLPDGEKYGKFRIHKEEDTKTKGRWEDLETEVFYYSTRDLNPPDLGHKSQYWYDHCKAKGGIEPNIIVHKDFRRDRYSYYLERNMTLIADYLINHQPELLSSTLAQMDELVETAKKKSKQGIERGIKKSAVTFTKVEQVAICKKIYDDILAVELKQMEKNIGAKFNCKFKFDYCNLTFSNKNYILDLASQDSTIKVDLTGQKLMDEIKKTKIDHQALLKDWMNEKDAILRRFALTFLDEKVVALLDTDEKIRLSAELKLKGEV
jgi:hypothetical protein